MVSNWKTSNITDLLKPNGIKIGPFGSQLKKELFIQNGDYKVYGQENVYAQNFKIGDRYMTRSHFDKLRSCELLPGDFVMSTMGTVGKCAIVPAHITRGIMDSHLIRLRFDEKVIDKTYLLQLFSPDIQFLKDQTDKLSVGGIMDGLSVKIVSSLTVEYPSSVEEQKAIVNALSAADGMISSLEKLIAKKKAVKQGAMQELLTGKKRLPGYSGEWERHKIGDYVNCYRGVSYSSNGDLFVAESDKTIRLLRSNNIQDAKFNREDVQYIRRDVVAENQKLQKSDIMICMANGSKQLVGKSCIFTDIPDDKYTLGAFMSCLRAKKTDTIMHYIFALLNSSQYWNNIALLLSGSSINNLRPNDILEMEFNFPILDEQMAIVSILSDMDNEIEALEQKLAKARRVKQGMMQQLLTGKIRLV